MLKKKCILLTVIICMLTSFLPFYTVSAAEYYDMKYFRFLASQSDDENLPGNVKEKDKKWRNLHKNITNLRKPLKNKKKKYIILLYGIIIFLGGEYEKRGC